MGLKSTVLNWLATDTGGAAAYPRDALPELRMGADAGHASPGAVDGTA